MKIVIVVPSLQEKGPVIVAENIARFSTDTTMKFFFISLRKNSENDRIRFEKMGVEIFEIGMGKLPTFKNIVSLRNIIRKILPDVIHAHSFWPTVLTAFNFRNVKKVVTVHNNPTEDVYLRFGIVVGGLMCALSKIAYKYFDKVVAISHYVREAHREYNVTNKCEVIYNGVPDINSLHIKAESEPQKEVVPILLSVSNLVKIKNIITGLKAVNLVVNQYGLPVKYYILGDGSEKQNLMNFVNTNKLEDTVFFLGAQPHEKVFEYLEKADLLLHPAISEGFGLAVVEAMMMNKPVIVSDIPIYQEMLENKIDAYLCPNYDEKAIAKAIIMLMDPGLRKGIGDKGRDNFLKKYTAEKMAGQYSELYNKIVAE